MTHTLPPRRRLAIAGATALAIAVAAGAAVWATDINRHPETAAPGAASHIVIASPLPTTHGGGAPHQGASPGVAVPHAGTLTNGGSPHSPVAPASTAAPADPMPVSSSDFYTRQAQLQGELALLKLQSQIAEVKKKIADASSDASVPPPASVIVAPPAAMTPQSGTPGTPARDASAAASISVPLPGEAPAPAPLRVASVLGVNGSYTAQLVDHGVDCTVSEGTTLSDGWRVTKIAPSTVVLVRGRARRILHVSG